MNELILGNKKLLLIIPLALLVILFTNIDCLAQQDKLSKLDKLRIVYKCSASLAEQRSKCIDLNTDTRSIVSKLPSVDFDDSINAISGNFLVAESERTFLAVGMCEAIINMYMLNLEACEPSERTNRYVQGLLPTVCKNRLEDCIEVLNGISSKTKKPVIAIQCDKYKDVVRETIKTIENITPLFN